MLQSILVNGKFIFDYYFFYEFILFEFLIIFFGYFI